MRGLKWAELRWPSTFHSCSRPLLNPDRPLCSIRSSTYAMTLAFRSSKLEPSTLGPTPNFRPKSINWSLLVYKCRRGEPYSRSDPEVALKVIPKTRIAKPSQRDKIDAEIQIQKSLDHPHIVKLVNHFEDQIKICLVLELCERKSLTTLLKQHGQVQG